MWLKYLIASFLRGEPADDLFSGDTPQRYNKIRP